MIKKKNQLKHNYIQIYQHHYYQFGTLAINVTHGFHHSTMYESNSIYYH